MIQRLGRTSKRGMCGRLTISISHEPPITQQSIVREASGACQTPGKLRALIAAVGEDVFDEGEEASRARVEHARCAVAVLDVCGVDGDVEHQAKRVDKNVPLAARDFLARIVARGVERRAPFCAPLTL